MKNGRYQNKTTNLNNYKNNNNLKNLKYFMNEFADFED